MLFFLEVFTASFAAGVLGSLMGIGGGLLLVPFLTLVMKVKLHYAIGASLVSVIATSSGAGVAYLREKLLNLRLGLVLNTATCGGAVVGAIVADKVSARFLSVLFGVVLLHSAYLMFRTRNVELPPEGTGEGTDLLRLHSSYYDPSLKRTVSYNVYRVRGALAGMFGAGMLSGMLGIGAGAFKVLVMDTMMRLPIKVSTTTSNFMLGVTAAASASMYFARGDIHPVIAAPVAFGVLAGATLGARLLKVLPGKLIRKLFVVVLLITALQMIWKGIQGGIS